MGPARLVTLLVLVVPVLRWCGTLCQGLYMLGFPAADNFNVGPASFCMGRTLKLFLVGVVPAGVSWGRRFTSWYWLYLFDHCGLQ